MDVEFSVSMGKKKKPKNMGGKLSSLSFNMGSKKIKTSWRGNDDYGDMYLVYGTSIFYTCFPLFILIVHSSFPPPPLLKVICAKEFTTLRGLLPMWFFRSPPRGRGYNRSLKKTERATTCVRTTFQEHS